LASGRTLGKEDSVSSAAVAIVNEAAAKHYFQNGDALGREIRFKLSERETTPAYRIVGVARNTKHMSLKEEEQRFVYLPIHQTGSPERRITLLIAAQSAGNEWLLIDPIRKRIQAIEPRSLVSEVCTIQTQIDETLLAERLLAGISLGFGALSLALAGVGIFGVLSFQVAQERKAIGIRMALGAEPSSQAMAVLRRSLAMAGTGIMVGVPMAVAMARSVWPLFSGIEKTEADLYVWSAVLIGTVGLCGSIWPAWKAARVSPQEALRE
jgi:hypothetical protein